MLTDTNKQRSKLSAEIIKIFAICFAISVIAYLILIHLGIGIINEYCFYNDIYLDEFEDYRLDSMVLTVSLVICIAFFIVLFFAMFGERLSYIRTITSGIDALQRGELDHRVEISGNNELTQLAEAINYLSETEEKVKEKERRLGEEREELIRTLSHDIRTPLTSIISYTELLEAKDTLTPEEHRDYLKLVSKKAAQIKELTDILLDGGKRDPEHFDDARLLIDQLADEFSEALEEDFEVLVTTPKDAFSGKFDVTEMRRIFDNLISNVQKYADKNEPVSLKISNNGDGLVIKQKNSRAKDISPSESFRMGINSIRRIAHNYGGRVEIGEDEREFEIVIILSDI